MLEDDSHTDRVAYWPTIVCIATRDDQEWIHFSNPALVSDLSGNRCFEACKIARSNSATLVLRAVVLIADDPSCSDQLYALVIEPHFHPRHA